MISESDQQFSVEEFVKLAEMAMEECFSRGRIPVIVGGTGFYIRAFLKGYLCMMLLLIMNTGISSDY